MSYAEDAPLTVGAMRAIMEPLLARLHSIDERQARIEAFAMSQAPGSPSRGLLGTSGHTSFPDKLRAAVSVPLKYSLDQRVEVEYKIPTPKLGGLRPGEIPRKKGHWYPATVLSDRGDNTYDVVYDDGEREIRVSTDLIRPLASAGGSRAPTPSSSALVPSAPKGAAPKRSAGGSGGARQSKSAGLPGSLQDFVTSSEGPLVKLASPDEIMDLPEDDAVEERKQQDSAADNKSLAHDGGGAAEGKSQEASSEDKGGATDPSHDDDEMVAGGGDESGCVKPWLGAVKPPKVPPAINPSEPSETLALNWVHGYTSAASGKYAVSNNLFYNASGDAIFPAAALGVKLSSGKSGGPAMQTYFQGHDDDILCLTVSKCRRFAATGQTASHTSKGKGHVCIWDCASMSLLTKLEGCHQRGILVVSFSPDSTKLLTVGLDDDNTHIVFGSTNGWKKVDKLSTDKGDKAAFLFSCWVRSENPITTAAAADSFNLVSASDKNVHLWSVDGSKLGRKKGSVSKKLAPKDVKLSCGANFATKDGWKVAMGGADGNIYLFGGKEADASIPSAHGKDIISMAEGGAGCTFLVTGGADKMVRLWSSELQKLGEFDLSPFAKVDATIGSIDVKPDCSALICGTFGGEIVEIAPAVGGSFPAATLAADASASVLLYSHFRGELWGLACHPTDSDLVATVGDDSTLRLWSISKNKLLSTTNIGWPGRMLTWHPNGDAIAIGLYELVKGGVEKKDAKGGKGGGAASGDKKASVLVYAINRTGDDFSVEKVASGCPSVAWICALRFSPSGGHLAVGSHDKKLYAYKVNPGAWADTFKKEKYLFNKHSSAVLHVDFTADEKFLQTTCQAGELLFHESETGKQETSAVKMAEYHGTDGVGEKRVFNTQTCTLGWGVLGIWPPGADGQFINSCDRSPNGKLLATSDDDGEVKIFRYPVAQENSKFNAYKGHSSHVTTVRFNASSEYVVSVGGNDKCLFMWKVVKR